MGGMICTDFFRCDRCHIECRIDSGAPGPFDSISAEPLTCGIARIGKALLFLGR
jgi:hypothetical protein